MDVFVWHDKHSGLTFWCLRDGRRGERRDCGRDGRTRMLKMQNNTILNAMEDGSARQPSQLKDPLSLSR